MRLLQLYFLAKPEAPSLMPRTTPLPPPKKKKKNRLKSFIKCLASNRSYLLHKLNFLFLYLHWHFPFQALKNEKGRCTVRPVNICICLDPCTLTLTLLYQLKLFNVVCWCCPEQVFVKPNYCP